MLQQDEPGVWRVALTRPAAGRYEYKFLLNGAPWLADPANPSRTWDGITGFNSL